MLEDGKRKIIIIVDYDMSIKETLRGTPEEKFPDYQTILCSNGRAALEIILTIKPALIITELQMSVMDGLEMIYKISKKSKSTLSRIIVASKETIP